MRLGLATLVLVALPTFAADPSFEIHEWGTFTSIAGADGQPVLWKAQSAEDLPPFVYRGDTHCTGLRSCVDVPNKGFTRSLMRLETPVIYFYATEAFDVSVSVDFPQGWLTEWYPWAANQSQHTLDWGSFRVEPSAKPTFAADAKPNHYFAAREVDAAPLRVNGLVIKPHPGPCATNPDATIPGCIEAKPREEWERFLFYRGVGNFPPLLAGTVTTKDVKLTPAQPLGQALVFERRGGQVGVTALEAGTTISVPRPALTGKVDDVRTLLVARLVATGLFEKEAKAMVKTWDDSWFEEGLRVFYVVPPNQTEAILPLKVKPAPKKTVRTMVGRLELLRPDDVDAVVRKLGPDPSFVKVLEVHATLGRFGDALMQRALEKSPEALRQQWVGYVGSSVTVEVR